MINFNNNKPRKLGRLRVIHTITSLELLAKFERHKS